MFRLLLSLVILNSAIFCNLSASEEVERIFTQIYKYGVWGKDEMGKGHSGAGSTLQATRDYIQFLEEFIKNNNIKSVVDLGCGDWMFSQYVNWGDVIPLIILALNMPIS